MGVQLLVETSFACDAECNPRQVAFNSTCTLHYRDGINFKWCSEQNELSHGAESLNLIMLLSRQFFSVLSFKSNCLILNLHHCMSKFTELI